MKIPFFNYPSLFLEQEEELLNTIKNVLSRGAYIMQQELHDFEQALADYLGVSHVIGVADGTIALLISLKAAEISEGDEVIVPSHTFVASLAAIHHAGATPVLADCQNDHLIDPSDIERKITDRTTAIMPVHLNGRTANMDPILDLAQLHNLKIIEDSAQALGSTFKGKPAGTFGEAGICSFYPSKTLGCFGDGGAVITNNPGVAELALLLRDHGRTESGEVKLWGYNSRLDNIQAAILNLKFKTYPQSIERRRDIARAYTNRLKDIPKLVLPPGPDDSNDHFDIYQNYEIECERRDDLRQFLADRGIGTIVQWGGWMNHQFKELALNNDVPHTEELSKRYMLLPMNTSLTDEDVSYICDAVEEFFEEN